ncbi:hypothetical protein BDV96DRAFT_360522 [Lophiotrema nucula]|uniref:Uncharacterized protein n=1 Tax=Lophiotrema nucula TaxID=690887 RepID=A0A6A5ZK62_9PLEO|nr:hypothetical protein BDV96DRAFT_360522 [Lophiotrema nucula]
MNRRCLIQGERCKGLDLCREVGSDGPSIDACWSRRTGRKAASSGSSGHRPSIATVSPLCPLRISVHWRRQRVVLQRPSAIATQLLKSASATPMALKQLEPIRAPVHRCPPHDIQTSPQPHGLDARTRSLQIPPALHFRPPDAHVPFGGNPSAGPGSCRVGCDIDVAVCATEQTRSASSSSYTCILLGININALNVFKRLAAALCSQPSLLSVLRA